MRAKRGKRRVPKKKKTHKKKKAKKKKKKKTADWPAPEGKKKEISWFVARLKGRTKKKKKRGAPFPWQREGKGGAGKERLKRRGNPLKKSGQLLSSREGEKEKRD